MNTDLFLAILSMDAYNRPGPETTDVALVLPNTGNSIGNAQLISVSDKSSKRSPD
jgi:hypothetical protein